MGRGRSTDKDRTAKRQIDVAKAFADAERSVDAVPVLMVPRAEVPWGELSELATNLLLRVDGSTTTRNIAIGTGTIAPPEECAREMAALARRGLLELKPTPAASGKTDEELELELELDFDSSNKRA